MKTSVLMKRELFGREISQNSKNEFFSATDLMKAGNKWRIENDLSPISFNDWYNTKSTQDFVKELESQYGTIRISGRGRGVHTWVHPYLFIDLALSINPKLKIVVYSWLYDNLIQYRNDSGDSYKKMCGALYNTVSNKSTFPRLIVDIANKIKAECGVTDWQEASEKQLKLRDKIHEYIAVLSDVLKNIPNIVDVATKKARQELKGKHT